MTIDNFEKHLIQRGLERKAYFEYLRKIFDSSIAFKIGNGDSEQWQIYFPGNDSFPSSREQRNKAISTFKTLTEKKDEYNVAPVDYEANTLKLTAQYNHKKYHQDEAFGILCNKNFGQLLAMLENNDIKLNMPVVECNNLNAPAIGTLLQSYMKDPINTHVRKRLEMVVEEEEPEEFTSKGVAVREHTKQSAESARAIRPSFIAHPAGHELSLFVDPRMTRSLKRGNYVSIPVTPPLISGMHQFRINDDVAYALLEKHSIPTIGDGKPTPIGKIKEIMQDLPAQTPTLFSNKSNGSFSKTQRPKDKHPAKPSVRLKYLKDAFFVNVQDPGKKNGLTLFTRRNVTEDTLMDEIEKICGEKPKEPVQKIESKRAAVPNMQQFSIHPHTAHALMDAQIPIINGGEPTPLAEISASTTGTFHSRT